jgi:general secretion pathway protein C
MDIPMDAAKRLTEWKERSPEQWLRAANRYLPTAVTAVLVLAIAYRLAALTWLVLPGADSTAAIPEIALPRTNSAQPQTTRALDSLMNSHLFGEAAKQGVAAPVVEQVDAPDTTLSLVLSGVHAKDGPDEGFAFISSGRSEQKFYQVGAAIDGGNGATLHSVYGDRVLINRSGRLETLRFPQEFPSRVQSPAARIAPPMPPRDTGGSLREVISANASRITDIIRASPHLEEGQMVGYRITPGRDRDSFSALGLEPGDVLTDVNGTVLNDMATSLQVFESLGEASMATVTVLREGAPQVIVIDMTQLQNLAENLQ